MTNLKTPRHKCLAPKVPLLRFENLVYVLHNLVPILQFQNVKKTYGGVLLLVYFTESINYL